MEYNDFCELYFKIPHAYILNRRPYDIDDDEFIKYLKIMSNHKTINFKSILLVTDIMRSDYELRRTDIYI